MSRFLLFLFSLVFLPLVLPAQSPAMLHFKAGDGLPSNEVYDVFRDGEGYIWFGTDHGLSRFDGYDFRNYSTEDGLTGNTIFGFIPDDKGGAWLRIFNNSICHLQHSLFSPWKYNAQLMQATSGTIIQSFDFDADSNLWFVTNTAPFGLSRQDFKTGKIENIPLPPGGNAFIRELGNGHFIAGMIGDTVANGPQSSQLKREGAFLVFNIENDPQRGLNKAVCRRREAGTYVFAFDGKACLIEKERISKVYSFGGLIHNAVFDSNQSLWLLCNNGACRIGSVGSDTTVRLTALPGETITAMLNDPEGNYWFTTLQHGVFLSHSLAVSVLNKIKGTAIDEVVGLDARDGRLVFADRNRRVFEMPLGSKGIDTARAKTVFDRNGNMINDIALVPGCAAVLYDKFFSCDGKTRLLYPLVGTPWCLKVREDGSVLIATNNSWGWFTRDGAIVAAPEKAFRKYCTAIDVSADSTIWVGTTEGLFTWRRGAMQPAWGVDSMLHGRITSVLVTDDGRVIVTTRGSGMFVLANGHSTHIGKNEGLSSNLCETVCMDGAFAWVATNEGLNRVQLASGGKDVRKDVLVISIAQGLPSKQVNDVRRSGDLLLLATSGGLATIDLKSFSITDRATPVILRGISVNNVAVPQDYKFGYDDNNVAFEFHGFNFRALGGLHYRYRLVGYEGDWHETEERVARYLGLPPGDYSFEVMARNENGKWNAEATRFSFHVPQYFMRSWWFGALMVALAVALGAGAFIYVLYNQRQKARYTTQLLLAEQKALRAQMKPHFLFNSLNAIQLFILDHDGESAHLYLGSFSKLVRRILEHSKKNFIPLSEELETLQLYLELEKLRFSKPFEITITMSEEVQQAAPLIPPLLIQPFVENAVWHGLLPLEGPARLSIGFTVEGKTLMVTIADNGVGRERAKQLRKRTHISTGMKNVEERISLLNRGRRGNYSMNVYDLKDENGEALGTKVVLRLPLISNETDATE